MPSQVHDAIVVGSGAAGCWAAKQLTEGGLDVLVLEAGRSIELIDYPLEPDWDSGMGMRLLAGARGQNVQARCPAFSARTKHFYVNDRQNPYSTPRDKPFHWFRGRQVGGRLHTWGRYVIRMSDHELSLRTNRSLPITTESSRRRRCATSPSLAPICTTVAFKRWNK